jgi:hypothetical protein
LSREEFGGNRTHARFPPQAIRDEVHAAAPGAPTSANDYAVCARQAPQLGAANAAPFQTNPVKLESAERPIAAGG